MPLDRQYLLRLADARLTDKVRCGKPQADILDALGVYVVRVAQEAHMVGADLQPDLLQCLPAGALGRILPRIKPTAGHRPGALSVLAVSADEENASVALDYERRANRNARGH